MEIKGKLIIGDFPQDAIIELTPQDLAEQLTAKELIEIRLIHKHSQPEKQEEKFCECKDQRRETTTYKEYTRCNACGYKIKPPEKIDLTNPYRGSPPHNFEDVHYTMCKLADKIDELIEQVNRMGG